MLISDVCGGADARASRRGGGRRVSRQDDASSGDNKRRRRRARDDDLCPLRLAVNNARPIVLQRAAGARASLAQPTDRFPRARACCLTDARCLVTVVVVQCARRRRRGTKSGDEQH